MSTFQKFPREIRDIIYEYSLSVKHALVPYNPKYNRSHITPAIALLSVSKAIRQEALPILIGCNSWVVSDYLNDVVAKENTGRSDYCGVSSKPLRKGVLESTIFYKYRNLFRSIQLDFCDHHWLRHHCSGLRGTLNLEPQDQDPAHVAYREIAVARGMIQDQAVAMMPNLETLVVDVGLWICPFLRCRIRFLRPIFENILKTTVAKNVRVVLRSPQTEAEKEIVKIWRNRGLNEGETGLLFAEIYDEDMYDDHVGTMYRY